VVGLRSTREATRRTRPPSRRRAVCGCGRYGPGERPGRRGIGSLEFIPVPHCVGLCLGFYAFLLFWFLRPSADQLRLSRKPMIENLPVLTATRQIQFVRSLLNLLVFWSCVPSRDVARQRRPTEQVTVCAHWVSRSSDEFIPSTWERDRTMILRVPLRFHVWLRVRLRFNCERF
jgi:hypothetical protein